MFRTRYQFYTNVHYTTCERCLALHGAIRRSSGGFGEPQDECERSIVAIPRGEKRTYREKGRRMRAAAQAELARRRLFEAGMAAIRERPEQAVEQFERAARIDVYVPEIERLVKRCSDLLAREHGLRETLRALYVKAFSDKFGRPRYERLPEVMRLQHEHAGIRRINELLR